MGRFWLPIVVLPNSMKAPRTIGAFIEFGRMTMESQNPPIIIVYSDTFYTPSQNQTHAHSAS